MSLHTCVPLWMLNDNHRHNIGAPYMMIDQQQNLREQFRGPRRALGPDIHKVKVMASFHRMAIEAPEMVVKLS